MNLGHHAVPTAGFDQADDGDQHGAEPDQYELQHLIEDGRKQAAQSDVEHHGDGGDPDADVNIPAEHHLHDERHGVHIDAAHEDGHQAEGNGGEGARRFAEAEFEVAGDGVRLGDVIERDHHDPEEDHGGNGADPIPVNRQNAVLIGRCGPAHEFERTQVGGEETKSRDPSCHLASREEEIFAGLGEPLQVEADSEDGHEIQNDDGEVDRGEGH